MNTTTLRVIHAPISNLPAKPANILPLKRLLEALREHVTNWKLRPGSWKLWIVLLLLLAIWFIPAARIHSIDPMAIAPDQSEWLMVLLSLITFLIIMPLCWWLVDLQWRMLGLPAISKMVLHFNLFTRCQQLVLYYTYYALVLLVAVGCLIAIFVS